MLEVIKRFEFEAAHHLENYDGPCQYVHGHSYKLDIGIAPKNGMLLQNDMVMDFKLLKSIVKENIIDKWDHTDLNTLKEFQECNPTAERMVKVIVHNMNIYLMPYSLQLTLVDLWETADSHCRWTI